MQRQPFTRNFIGQTFNGEEHIMNDEKEVKILAIESSCDETSAAVVVNGRKVLSNIIYSQIDIHTLY